MSAGEEERPSLTVRSGDGTPIAVWSTGAGPPLLLVHGAMSDHRRWRITPLLARSRTVHAMDRRGRGGSGDGASWSMDREVDDVVAVLGALGDASGSAVDLLGHSLGGLLALRAAAASDRVRRLVLYEPSVNEPALPQHLVNRMQDLLAAGRREDVVLLTLREVVLMPEEEIAAMLALPSWPTRVAAAHTLPRELSTPLVWDPAEAARITTPTLMVLGGDSPELIQTGTRMVAEAVPDSTLVVIDGQQHVADQFVPDLFARIVLDFLLDAAPH